MNSNVPFFSMTYINESINFYNTFKKVLDSSCYILGPEVKKFENEFADYCGSRFCVGLASGTDALELALKTLDITSNGIVLTIANAGFYSSHAILSAGLKPYYIEIEENYLNMSFTSLFKAVCDLAPQAIILTHLYGQIIPNIEDIIKLASSRNIPVIEDCAQAHGAVYNGKKAGNFGTLSCFSFYPTKNLGAFGDGGAIITNNSQLADRTRKLRQYGWGEKYRIEIQGGSNSRLDELQAAFLRAKLPRLDDWNHERRAIATQYNKAFSRLPMRCPLIHGDDYVAHLYVIQVNNRNSFKTCLKKYGVASAVHYPVADYKQMAYSFEQKSEDLPLTEKVCNQVISLPCYPGMTREQINKVINTVLHVCQSVI